MFDVIFSMLLFYIASYMMISAIMKMIYYREFLQLVRDYQVLPSFLATIWGALLPILELGSALLLLIPKTVLYGAGLLSLLLVSFAIAGVMVKLKGRKLSCGCYGRLIDADIDGFTLSKILYFLLLTLGLVALQQKAATEYPPLAVVSGLFLTLLTLAGQKLWVLHHKAINLLK